MGENWPFSDLFQSADAYLYFWRNWHDSGTDVIVWWQEKEHFSCCCFVTGEQNEPGGSARNLIDRQISGGAFQHLMDEIASYGVMEIASQAQRVTTSHFDDTIAIRLPGGHSHHFRIEGGKHKDHRADQITDLIWKSAPELSAFYREEFS